MNLERKYPEIIKNVEKYYGDKVNTYGPTAKGVDWNSVETQELRFEQLLKLIEICDHFSIIDYGCGYAYLYEYLIRKGLNYTYFGVDISPEMLRYAEEKYGDRNNFYLHNAVNELGLKADYTFASGVFNVKMKHDAREWESYAFSILDSINRISVKGFAFNCLTSYADREHMRSDLYYADPCLFFDYCQKKYSRHVTLYHNYGLYEFTILVEKR